MHKIIIVSIYVFVVFIIQNVLLNLFGQWFKPNILIILVVFFNLYRGIRYSLFAALLAGLLMDSMSVKVFGLHIFAYILCAYLTTFIKMYIYQPGSDASRILMVFLISLLYFVIQYLLNLMFVVIPFDQAFVFVLIPEVLTTTVMSLYFFEKFKQCASKLFA